MGKIKKKILTVIEKAEKTDGLSRSFDLFIMALILINVVVIMMDTVVEYHNQYEELFDFIEIFSVAVFSIEYLIRIWTCTLIPKYSHHWFWGRVKYVFSVSAIIDLIAILPFYLPLLIPMNMMLIRMLRLFRLLRIFKLGRYFRAFEMVQNAVFRRKDELIIVLGLIAVMMILSSSMMFYIENAAQPEVFTSIPATMWWAVATLTTVGYGDVYPITPMGKLLGAFIAILGIGVFALPAGIIATSFESELSRKKKEEDAEE
ncbi:MAG: ion transporter [Reichenbachiella sp.]